MFSNDAVLLTAKMASMKAGISLGTDTSVVLQVLNIFTKDSTGAVAETSVQAVEFPPFAISRQLISASV
jgi:hypothetical protein